MLIKTIGKRHNLFFLMYDQMNDDDSENIEILIRKSGIRRSHFNNPNVKKVN